MDNTGLHLDITVETTYVEAESDPMSQHYLFAYTITIHNRGLQPTTLINRHWLVTDSNGDQQEVSGIGVIGKQPMIMPDTCFQYTSGAVLKTPVGSMQGSYDMITDNGDCFQAQIEPFSLAVPDILH